MPLSRKHVQSKLPAAQGSWQSLDAVKCLSICPHVSAVSGGGCLCERQLLLIIDNDIRRGSICTGLFTLGPVSCHWES